MGAAAVGRDVDAEGAVASALDLGVGRLGQDREVGGEQLGPVGGEAAQPVECGLDLLVVVPDPGDVDGRLGELRGEREHDRAAALHVDGAAAPEDAVLASTRQVVVDRDGVDVARDHDPLCAAEVGAGDDRVAVADHLEVREPASAASIASASSASLPDTDSMSTSWRVSSSVVVRRSRAGTEPA